MTLEVEKSKTYRFESEKFLTPAGQRSDHQYILNFSEVEKGTNVITSNNKNSCLAGELKIGGYFASVCDIGNRYKDYKKKGAAFNEDALLKIEIPDITYIAVADGIGGHPAGQIASHAFLDYMGKSLIHGSKPDEAFFDGAKGLISTHLACRRNKHYKGEDTSNMGLCFAMAEIIHIEDKTLARFFHCGDSKAMVIKKDCIIETRDHSAINYHMDTGLLIPGEIVPLELNGAVSSFISLNKGSFASEAFNVETGEFFLVEKDDLIIVGSDGLFDNVWLNEIKQIQSEASNFPEQRQIEIASRIYMTAEDKINRCAGKIDNISLAVFEL